MLTCKRCDAPIEGRGKKAIFCSPYCNTKFNAKNAESKTPLGIRKRAVKYKYGIEWEDLEALHEAADGRCEICLTPIVLIGSDRSQKTNTAHVDHSHVTGKVRGVLCLKCNVGLGAFLDSRLHLQKALEYLDKHADGLDD